jgi:hypothetical protein
VAVYPVDARGARPNEFYEAGHNLSSAISADERLTGVHGAQASTSLAEDSERNADQEAMRTLAHDTGGKAFVNSNGFSQIISEVVKASSDFYTVSYTPENRVMDGSFRRVEVNVAGGKYTLSYRRGYYADDMDLPGAPRPTATTVAATTDPLRPFEEFGMPQTEQILYKALIKPVVARDDSAPAPQNAAPGQLDQYSARYSVDFAVDLKDLRLKLDPDGLHTGTLNLCLIVYDRYGHVISRKDHLVALNIKPNVYEIFKTTGVQLHDSIEVPKGQFWLRTGVYDQASRKVGTMEVPLSSVKPIDMASK